jgi:hypothetical protein
MVIISTFPKEFWDTSLFSLFWYTCHKNPILEIVTSGNDLIR